MSELAAAAVAYAERCWPVFPVEARGKKPLGRLVPHGLKQATIDVDVVEAWWRKAPAANIGLATGHGFDVLDIDSEEAMRALDRACFAAGPAGETTIDGPTCRTGGGGVHCYVAPTGVGNKAGMLGEKLDWRGIGGYVVAPPSVHSSGQGYRWEPGGSPADVEPQVLPSWCAELLGVGVEKPAPAAAAARGPSFVDEGAYGRRALEAEVGRVVMALPGRRNHQLNEAAFAIGQLIAGREIEDIAGAVEALETAGSRAGLTAEEVKATVRSGLDSGSKQPRSAPQRLAR